MARALYNFVGQTARELTFRKGDLIYVRRQVDKNWYEGELNAMVGLFPTNYVEVGHPYDAPANTFSGGFVVFAPEGGFERETKRFPT